MTEMRGILGDAERCCPEGLCIYMPALIQTYLDILAAARRAGEDPTASRVLARSAQGETLGRACGVSTSLDIRLVGRLWDVQRAIATLQAEGNEATAIAIARILCPWSLED